MDHLYNSEYKNAFLETLDINEASKRQYISMFNVISKAERDMKKDLFDMTFKELELVFRKSERSKPQSMISYIGIIKKYIDWAKINGYGVISENPIVGTINEAFADKYLFKLGKTYYTNEELIESLDKMINFREKAMVLAAFEGILGQKASELINLKYTDLVREGNNYYAYVVSNELKGTIRKIEISELLYRLLLRANDETSIKTITNGTQKIAEGDYIFRRIRTNDQGGKVSQGFLNNVVSNYIKTALKSTEVTLMSLKISGVMHKINEKMGEDKVLTKEIANSIIEEYELSTFKMNGIEYPHYTSLKRLIDIEWMKDTYGGFECLI